MPPTDGSQSRPLSRRVWVIAAVVAVVAAVAAWWLPGDKGHGVFGRLVYWQFMLAGGISLLALVAVLLALMPEDARRWAAPRAGIVVAAIVVGLAVIEAGASFWPAGDPRDNPFYLFNEGGVRDDDTLPYARPSYLKWTGLSRGDLAVTRGDLDPFARTVTFQTDYQGFRNSRDRRAADVVFIGDSVTEAGNVPEENTFVALTSKRLGLIGRNMGRAGYSTPHELVVLRKYALPCEPRVVVWQVAESNDLYENVVFENWIEAGRPPRKPTRRGLAWNWQRQSLTYRLFQNIQVVEPWPLWGIFTDADGKEHEVRFSHLTKYKTQSPNERIVPEGHAGLPLLRDSLDEGRRLLAQQDTGAHMVVLLIPMKLRVMGPYVRMSEELQSFLDPDWQIPPEATLAAYLSTLCREWGVTFVDATPLFLERSAAGDLVYLPLDTHLSDRGHELLSDLLVDAIAGIVEGERPEEDTPEEAGEDPSPP